MDLYDLLRSSFTKAFAECPASNDDLKKLHQKRSKEWVNRLGEHLASKYGNNNRRVFWRGNPENKDTFGLNEFLFDIVACEILTTYSYSERHELDFVSKADWIIESEFVHDSREWLKDFSKLIMGFSENYLFIGPSTSDEDSFLRVFKEPAQCIGEGNLYLACVPHPAKWNEEGAIGKIKIWEYRNRDWTPIKPIAQ